MPETDANRAKELLDKALERCPQDSTGRLAVLGAGFALLEVRGALLGIKAELAELRALMTSPTITARRDSMSATLAALSSNLPSGVDKISQCRSCDAPVMWCGTRRGKKMPVDARPDPDGDLGIDKNGIAGHGIAGPKYTSHFATCPDASEHRNPRQARE